MGKLLSCLLAAVLTSAAFAQDAVAEMPVAKAALAPWTGKCVSVADGDTISVMHDGAAEKLRLNGIDCPEMGQPFGTKAKQYASKMSFGQEVTVKPKEKDKYGRTVADVVLPDGRVLNQEMVKFGYAWWYREYNPNDEVLKKYEADAKEAEVGLWSDENPVAPWDWRHNGGNPKTAEKPVAPPAVEKAPAPVVAPAPAPVVAPKPAPASADEVTVYVTRTGSKYHRAGCRYLSKSKIPISLKDAKARYGACSVCNPPE